VAAEAGIHAYLARTLGVPLVDMIEVLLPESYAEVKADVEAEAKADLSADRQMADVDLDDPADALVDAIRSTLETFLAADDDGFVDEFERDAYRDLRPEVRALDHSGCGVGGCRHVAWAEAELKLRSAERRARAAAPEPVPAVAEPLTPEQQDRRYPGLPRGSDD
jgi:hypothetical protein